MKYKLFLFLCLFILNSTPCERSSNTTDNFDLRNFVIEKITSNTRWIFKQKKALKKIINYLYEKNIELNDPQTLILLDYFVGLAPLLDIAAEYDKKQTEEYEKKLSILKSIIKYMVNNNKAKQELIGSFLKQSIEANEDKNINFFRECLEIKIPKI